MSGGPSRSLSGSFPYPIGQLPPRDCEALMMPGCVWVAICFPAKPAKHLHQRLQRTRTLPLLLLPMGVRGVVCAACVRLMVKGVVYGAHACRNETPYSTRVYGQGSGVSSISGTRKVFFFSRTTVRTHASFPPPCTYTCLLPDPLFIHTPKAVTYL